MFENRPLKEMEFHVEHLFPDIQHLLEGGDNLLPLPTFIPIINIARHDFPAYLNWTRRNKDMEKDVEPDSEDIQESAPKRLRLSL